MLEMRKNVRNEKKCHIRENMSQMRKNITDEKICHR
jgi:hypothetical protein